MPIDLANPELATHLQMADSCYWAVKNRIKLLGGTEFTLDGCGYLADIMQSDARKKAIQKAAQARITTVFMLDVIHNMIHKQLPQGAIYYFPTERSVENFSKTRFGPLVADNPCIRRHLRNTNSVSIKRVGNTFLRLFGTSATKLIEGEKKDSTTVRSEPADYIIRDERDLFDEDMAEQTKQRIMNSTVKKEVDLGTPTMPDYGTNKVFMDSDQRHWHVPCRACNEFTCIALEFPNSIKFRKVGDKYEPYIGCIKCGKPIFPGDGEWVAKYRDNDEIAGWHVSHFLSPNIDLKDVMYKYEKAEKSGKKGEFYNSILGMPWISAEDRLKVGDVFECCGGELMAVRSALGTAMGADIGKTHHVVIAERKDKERAKVIYIGKAKGFDELHDLAVRFNVKSAVIDLRPYEESFRKFQAAEPYKVFGCEYRDKMRHFCKEDDKAGIYVVNRTEIFDRTHRWIINKQVELPRQCEEVREFAKQVCSCAKRLEETNEGDRLYRYRKLGPDHYRSALNFLVLALQNLHDYNINPLQIKTIEEDDLYNPLTWDLV